MSYDFSGYATKNDLKCSDGRTIKKDAFIDDDKKIVPLVWQHQHNDPDNVLGHCELENRSDGVYCYCTLNDTPKGLTAKKLVKAGDIKSLSIYANHLVENRGEVHHGAIKEVSLVLSGANPGAFIDFVSLAHSDSEDEHEGIIYADELIDFAPEISHADEDDNAEVDENQNGSDDSDETIGDIYKSFNETQKRLVDTLCELAVNGDLPDGNDEVSHSDEKTVEDVFNSMTEKQRNVAYYLIGLASNLKKEGDSEMAHEDFNEEVLYHADKEAADKEVADKEDSAKKDDETVEDVLNTLNEKQAEFVETVLKAAKAGKDAEDVDVDKSAWESMSEKQQKVVAFVVGSVLKHEDDDEEYFEHADDKDEEDDGEKKEAKKSNEEIVASLSPEKKSAIMKALNKEITQADFAVAWGKFTQEERDAVYALAGGKSIKHSDDLEGGITMNNIFEETTNRNTLSHADTEAIFADAKKYGSLKEAFLAHADGDYENHGTAGSDYGVGNYDYLFPDAQLVNKNIEMLRTDPTNWVSKVMNGVKKSPFTRIKSIYANLTGEEARARGYIKSNQKQYEVISLLKRETSPTTVYKIQKLDRDDILDITDWDVVAWLKAEMRIMLEEEIARAILIGDGRASGDQDKIDANKIRPIAFDLESTVFTGVGISNAGYAFDYDYEVVSGADEYEAFVDECNLAMIEYRGSGSPTLFTTPEMVARLLLIKDGENRRMYRGRDDLANALGVKEIVEVPYMATQSDLKFVKGGYNYDIKGIIVNLADYTVGTDKGGQISMFDDFDIDFNQQKYLIETRMSGALTKFKSAIVMGKKGSAVADDEDE